MAMVLIFIKIQNISTILEKKNEENFFLNKQQRKFKSNGSATQDNTLQCKAMQGNTTQESTRFCFSATVRK